MRNFEEVKITVIKFSCEDVITTSGAFSSLGTYSENPGFGALDSIGRDLLN